MKLQNEGNECVIIFLIAFNVVRTEINNFALLKFVLYEIIKYFVDFLKGLCSIGNTLPFLF
jgi:hypothetical protein